MDLSLERDSSAFGSLFQQIINDMKNTSPLWEDFVAKTSKLHACLRAAIQAIAAYLDAFQKIADAATNSRGASKEIGTALTRVCLRHKAVETRLKTFTTAIMDCLVQPLQDKLEDWKRSVATIDKDHAKEYKRCRTELKKRSSDTLRLQKKARKGQSDTIQSLMDSHMQDVTLRRAELEEVEKKSLRSAMIEERMRYCTFVHMLQPVVKEECEVMSELGHLQEAMQSIANVTKEPNVLPQASEELIHDAKATMTLYPESPGGGSGSQGGCSNSLGSRKSSVCSISSMNSSGSSNSPGHHHYPRSLSQLIPPATIRLKPGESSDSGFCSSPALTTQASTATSQSHAVSTWPPHSQENVALPPTADRPHTISTAYEKGHQRPPLTVYTFQNPETIMEGVGNAAAGASAGAGTNGVVVAANNGSSSGQNTPTVGQKSPAGALSRPPLPVRCSSLERPLSANNNRGNGGNLMARQCPSPIPAHITKELSVHHAQQQQQSQQQQQQQQPPSQSPPPPTYVNMSELANMAAKKSTTLQQQHSIDSISSQFSNDFVPSHSQQQHQQAPAQTRSHSNTSSSTTSSNTPSLHSHPSIESTVATPLVGQTPTPSSGSSTPQNHYSPLLTNSPSSTAAGTPSGGSITSGMLTGGFNYNVSSPTPPPSGTPSTASDVLKITETDVALHSSSPNYTTAPTDNTNTNTYTCTASTTTTSSATNGADADFTSNTNENSNSAVDTDSPTIVENDERSRASVLQKASMFEKQAAAANSTPPTSTGRACVDNGIYGTRRSEEYRERDRSLPTHIPQQHQQQQYDQQQPEQQDVDKSFEDSIQELNNLIGELDSFQREIDAGKQHKQQQQQQQHAYDSNNTAMATSTTLDPFSSASGKVDEYAETTATMLGEAPVVGVSINAATTLIRQQQQLQQQQQQHNNKHHYCPSSSNQTNSSGCGTDISDTTSDELAGDDTRSLTSLNYNNNNNNNANCANSGNVSEIGGIGLKLNCNYNSDSELSRCYVSETSSLAGGYENPTFAHFASSSSTSALSVAAVAAAAAPDTAATASTLDDSLGDSRSLFAADSISHTSETLSMHRHAYVDNGSDSGSAVVVIYDHQIPMTPDMDYAKQNSEIVVLRTKDPQQQQLQLQEMRELQQLPANLGGGSPTDSSTAPFAAAHTATVAPAKQRLSSFRTSSEQQLQLLGVGSGGHSGSRQQQHQQLQVEKGTASVRSSLKMSPRVDNVVVAMPPTVPATATTPTLTTPSPSQSTTVPVVGTGMVMGMGTGTGAGAGSGTGTTQSDTIIRRKLPPKPSLSIFNGGNISPTTSSAPAAELNNNHNNMLLTTTHTQQQKPLAATQLPQPRPPLMAKADFKADLDAKIRKQKQKLLLQEQKQQQQQHEHLQSSINTTNTTTTTTTTTPTATPTTTAAVAVAKLSNDNCNVASKRPYNASSVAPASSSTPQSLLYLANATSTIHLNGSLDSTNHHHQHHHQHQQHHEQQQHRQYSSSSTHHHNPFHYQQHCASSNSTTQPQPQPPPPPPPTPLLSQQQQTTHQQHLHQHQNQNHNNFQYIPLLSATSSAMPLPPLPPLPAPSPSNPSVVPVTASYPSAAVSYAYATAAAASTVTSTASASASASARACSSSASVIAMSNKPSITPRPASLTGGATRIARRSSVNAAKPPPPVRRSSSVTPSHSATSGHEQQQQQQQHITNTSSYSATNLLHQQQNSMNNSTESLPPPPAYLLDARQTHSTPTSPPPPPAPSSTSTIIPNSSLKVAETVKALSAIRHKPASPTALRSLHQQQAQHQQQHQHQQALQEQSTTQELSLYSTTSGMMHDEPDSDYDAYYHPYVEVNATYATTTASTVTTTASTLQPFTSAAAPPLNSRLPPNAHQSQYQQRHQTNMISSLAQLQLREQYDPDHNEPPPLPPPNPNHYRPNHNQHYQPYDNHRNHHNHHHPHPLPPQQQQYHQQQQPLHQQQQQQQEQLNNCEAIYGNNSSFRTSSPGIYAQPKVMANMSSFRSASPGPNGHHIHQPQAHHPPAQPKTNPNLIAQLNARLNKQQQHQQNIPAETIYGSGSTQQQQQQHQQHTEPIYMRNYAVQQHQQQHQHAMPSPQQQQQQHFDDYASTNIDKAGSIRSKTKAEFLENLNAKLAKQGMSGRAFAVRNLINSKALPDPRLCHESLMDQIKRGATLKRNQKINDRSAPKIH